MRILKRYLAKEALCLVIIGLFVVGINLPAFAEPGKPPAKNIIVMIADGSGFNHVKATSFFTYGKKSKQAYNQFPFKYGMSTYMAYSVGDPCYGIGYDPVSAWSDFDYVKSCYTDSAAAATALSTGVKTYNGAIGVDMDENPLQHAIELAEQKGKSTGVVTSVEFTHATPAAFVAHNVSRNNYAEIGQGMVYDSAADVIMGAGHPCYDADGVYNDCTNTFNYVGGQITWDDLVAGTAGGDADGDGVNDPWVLIQTRAEFQALMDGPTPKRVIGVAQVYQTLQQGRSGDAFDDPYIIPFIETVPTLEEMTKAALNILDDDPDGLFLMVEGGAVDWASHDNQSGRMIEEQRDFDMAVKAVVDWVKKNSNWGETLLIVTSDHETGYLNGPDSNPTWEPIVNNGTGILPGMEWDSTNHTNSLVPLFAIGKNANLFPSYADEVDTVHGKYVDNTELAEVVFEALGPQ